ncbi:MAG TPA: DUF4169 family protein [Alphaproteobacteria bacterium]|nr:DUF4169 family protein [Alphaproteobacteria bacterium]
MSEIANLRQVRKRADRAKREETAAANRAKFGQSKAERTAAKAEADKRRALLDGVKREDPQ